MMELIKRLRVQAHENPVSLADLLSLCREAADAIENLQQMLRSSEEARSDLARQLAAARKQVDELTKAGLIATEKANKAIAERDAALLMKREGVRADDLPDLQEEL